MRLIALLALCVGGFVGQPSFAQSDDEFAVVSYELAKVIPLVK